MFNVTQFQNKTLFFLTFYRSSRIFEKRPLASGFGVSVSKYSHMRHSILLATCFAQICANFNKISLKQTELDTCYRHPQVYLKYSYNNNDKLRQPYSIQHTFLPLSYFTINLVEKIVSRE